MFGVFSFDLRFLLQGMRRLEAAESVSWEYHWQGSGFRVVFLRFLKFTVPAMGGLPGGERPCGFGVLGF